MDGKKQKSEFFLSSKFWRTVMVVLAVLLTFVGPTYFVYVLLNVLGIGYAVSMISGFVIFIAGLALIGYLIKSKVIS